MNKMHYVVILICLLMVALIAVFCAITVTGSGFVDMSNIIRYVSISIAVICVAIAFFVFRCSKKRK